MMQTRPLLAAEKLELLQVLYRRLPAGQRLKASTMKLLHLFADCAASLHWSVERIGETIGYSPRTVARALAELRACEVLTSVRKRRETSQRFLHLEKAREITAASVISIKRRCAIAVGWLRGGLDLPRKARSDLLDLVERKMVVEVRTVRRAVPPLSAPDAGLEAALERLRRGVYGK